GPEVDHHRAPSSLLGLHKLGRKANELEAVVYTHLHGDHCAGFPFLIIDALFADRRERPLRFVGPPGLEARLMGLLDLTYGRDILDRPGAPPLVFDEVRVGDRVDVEGLSLVTFQAGHIEAPDQSQCLRFESPGGPVVAFSGDTEMCEGLISAGAQADLLVAECSGLAPPIGRHCSWSDWRQALPGLDVGRVVLTHLGREVRRSIPALLAECVSGPPFEFADDGLVLELLPRAAHAE
ncbi:MAG: MBL fold metallo-hydrolase, partial [Myxococcota bacterium]